MTGRLFLIASTSMTLTLSKGPTSRPASRLKQDQSILLIASDGTAPNRHNIRVLQVCSLAVMALHAKSRWRYGGIMALLLLSIYLTITTLPSEGRSLRASLAITSDPFQGIVTTLGTDKPKVTFEVAIDEGLVLPSDEFFSEPRTSPLTEDSLKIAWLMSFPNSGTSYSITLIRHLTLTSSATNYGHELYDNRTSVPVFADQPTGPFWYEPISQNRTYLRPVTSYVLTKTHCGIRCETCPPQKYLETTFSFRRRCLSGARITAEGDKELVMYPADKVARAIHLIRDPFDNVVSRFHMERRKTAEKQAKYASTRDGFVAFCQDMNDAFSADEERAPFIDQSILAMLENVPCRADFIRYIEWHNLAFATTADMELQTYVLHYDWYDSRFNETMHELVDFLGAEIRADPEPFVTGKVYKDYFTSEQRSRVKLALESMASSKSWRHIGRYFDEQ